MRVEAPTLAANAGRNAAARPGRRRRWRPARDALWEFLSPAIEEGARVGIVGVGNGDDVPLRRIVRRADSVVLIDIDPRAAEGARRRLRRRTQGKVEVIAHDVTEGAADRIVLAAVDAGGDDPTSSLFDGGGDHPPSSPLAVADRSRSPVDVLAPAALHDTSWSSPVDHGGPTPLPGGPYDLIVGDLFYSQLLYPALLDLEVEEGRRAAILDERGPDLTRAVVARLQASAARVVHVHDPLAWWDGHEQPVALADVLALATAEGPGAALDLAARGLGPTESDPRAALADLGLSPAATALWPWPFAPGVEYLACATLVDSA